MKQIITLSLGLFLALPVLAQDVDQFDIQDQRVSIFDVMKDTSLSLDQVKEFAKRYFESDKEGTKSERKRYERWLSERKYHSDEFGHVISMSTDQEKYEKFRPSDQDKAITVGTWTNDGPFGWNATSGWNPGNGRLMDVAVHPSNTNVIVVGSPDGGIWRSTNGGSTWQPRTDNNAARMQIGSVAVAPSDSNRFYAGTLDGIVLKSTNGGSNWSQVSSSNSGPEGEIRKIIVNPTREDMILVAASNGIWKTYDAGASWVQRLNTTIQVNDIEYKPGQTKIMYASSDRFYKSTNWGNSWTRITAIPTSRRTKIAVSPDNVNAVYVIQSKTDRRSFDKLYLSTDSGDSFSTRFQRTSSGGNNLFGFDLDDNRGQAFLHMGIAVNPDDWEDVHVGGLVTFRSTNRGSSFTQTSVWLNHDNPVGYTHSDVTQLQYVGGTIYITTDGGLYKSTNDGADWTDLSNGLSIRTAYRMGSSLTDSNLYVAGFQDTGSIVHDSSGFRDWLGADGMEGLIHPTINDWIFGTSQFGQTYWSGDRGTGQRVNLADLQGPWITPWAIGSTVDASTGYAVMYAGNANGIQKSTNGGGSYFKISPNSGTTALPGAPEDLTIDHNNSNYIYAAVGSTIYHSHNGGTNWYRYTASNMGSKGNITDIKVHPTNSALIYFVTDNNTSSGGNVFSYNVVTGAKVNRSGNLPKFAFRSIVIDHSSPYRLYAAGNVGIYASDNNGSSWTDISSNLPKVPIREIDLQRSSHKLRVATYGRGIWEYSRGANSFAEDHTEELFKEEKNAVVYPNPARDMINIDLSKIDNPTSVIIMGTTGITRKRHDNIKPGTKRLTMNVNSLNPGVYMVHIMNNSGIVESVNFIKK